MIRSKPNCFGIALRRSRSSWGERHPILLATYDEYKYMALILEQQKVLLVEDVVDEVATPRVLLEMCIIVVITGPFIKKFPCNHIINIKKKNFFFRRSKRQRNFSLLFFTS